MPPTPTRAFPSPPRTPMTTHPHEDFFASPDVGAADALAPGAVAIPILSACALLTQRLILLHVCVDGHVSSGAQRCVAASFCAASFVLFCSSSFPTSTQRGTGRQTSDGEQLPSLMHTVGSHHVKPFSLFDFDPAGQSSAFAIEGTISANGTRPTASRRSVMAAHANIQSVTLAEGSGASGSKKPLGWQATHREKRLTTADGTGIAYEVLGRGEHTIVLANGLGGRLYAWEPAIEAFWSTHRLVTWDYRGLFASDSPKSKRKLAVTHHVDDIISILDEEEIDRAVFVGWSMGVQVSLDVAASYPERVAGLVLINGTHGHVLSTGFQPVVSVPFLPKRLHQLLDWLQDNPEVAHQIARIARLSELPTWAFMRLMAGRRARDLTPLLSRYVDDVLGSSFPNYLRLFQELDAHSTFHLLREIDAPALVISGFFDILTPPYQSKEIADRMPNAEYIRLWRSSHFSMLERPEIVIPAMKRFLEQKARY
jgi:3-oxoadipate enol-lactonase